MSDPRQTVERLRAHIHSGAVSASADVMAAAAEYAGFCRAANERLERCGDFLLDELAGEAVAHAAARPPLLDLVALLQFPEVLEWEGICDALGLPKAQRLMLETAKRVSDAAARQQPLLELLAKHRYLALSRAPLADRLRVVRQLYAADAGNAAWKQDVEQYELARVATLGHETSIAIKDGNVEAIERLQAEVSGGSWLTPLPVDVLEALPRAAASLRQAQAIDRLRALIPEVRQALAVQSYDRCRLVFARWANVVQSAKLNVPKELVQEILPLGRLIDQRDEALEHDRKFRSACDDLAYAANHHAPLEQLTRLYRTASAMNAEIPDQVMLVYRRAADAARRDLARERRKQLVLSAVLVATIGVALGGLAYVMFWMGKP